MKNIIYKKRSDNNTYTELVPAEGFLKFLYHTPFGKIPLNLIIKRKFLSTIYGKLMSSGFSKRKIKPFIDEYQIDMSDSIKSADEFTSFNDFFYRKLRFGAIKKGKGISSPAQGKIIAFENIDKSNSFFIKGNNFNLSKYLQNQILAKQFEGGTLAIIRLAPTDYHRFHFPASGTISESKLINGTYKSVSPYAVKENMEIFFENKREYSILKTERYGDIIISEVGATMVGGIHQTYAPDTEVEKSSEKGYFSFGGSTVVLLFEKNKVSIDDDIIKNTLDGYETQINVGESIGT